MSKISEGLEAFLGWLRESEQLYRMSEASEQEANARQTDIEHSLELEEHTYHEFAQLGKELKQVRQQRRAAKDTLSATYPILAWMDENRAVIKSLERLLGDVRKVERNAENRIYTPRTKKKEATP